MKTLRFWPWAAAILSGLLLTACFPRWNQAWLCWIALTPLIAAVWFGGSVSLKRAALLGYAAGLVFFWGVFSWLTTVTVAGWFLLPFYLALFPAAWAVFLAAIRGVAGDCTRSGANLGAAALGAAAWTALEWLRGLGALSFGWNGLGVSLHANLAMIQITAFTGVGGLSFLAAFANGIAVLTVRRFLAEAHTRRLRPHWDFSVCMALIAAVFSYGVRTIFAPAPAGGAPLRVAAVQANIPQDQKFDRAFEDHILERYAALTESALATRPRLLLWPEASTPEALDIGEIYRFVSGIAERGGVNFVLGSLGSDEARHDYNIAALFAPGRNAPQIYRKIHLVPFGEYIPFRKAFPPFEWIIGDLVPGDFTPGDAYTLLHLNNPSLDAAALVCFEDTLGDLTRHFVANGAQLLINITNDGWFLQSQGAEQHLANARFRAVENHRPLLRAANTGVTTFIDSRGRITNTFQPDGTPFAEGVLAGSIQVPPAGAPQTFYTRHGERFSQACAVASLLAAGLLWRRRRHTR
ncbi:MAG: apolipoprotein N-acyltransferase [Verrucomicrobiota bacterium]